MEAMIVSQADFLGSRVGMLDAKLAPMKQNGSDLPSEWKAYGQRYVMGNAIKKWFNEK